MAWSIVSKYSFDKNGGGGMVNVGDPVEGFMFSLDSDSVFV